MSDRLTLRHLRYFVTVGEELNFRRAAERLAISQPPLSRQIQELEEIVGTMLLARSTTKVNLTPAGAALMRIAEKILRDSDQLIVQVREVAEKLRPIIRIGVPPTMTAEHVTAVRGDWTAAVGEATLEVDPATSPELSARLLRGELDFAVIGMPSDIGHLPHEEIYVEPLVVALPLSHPAAQKRKVRLADVADLTLFWWARSFNPPYFDLCMHTFHQQQVRPRIETVAPGSMLTLERIAHGDGYTLQNRSRAETRMRGLAYRPLANGEAMAIRLCAVWQPALDGEIAKKLVTAVARVMNAKAGRG
jgi:LysR family transcriptional regulator, benzoate and cis,cis-muconate-responsive activator of ben and cat genes